MMELMLVLMSFIFRTNETKIATSTHRIVIYIDPPCWIFTPLFYVRIHTTKITLQI